MLGSGCDDDNGGGDVSGDGGCVVGCSPSPDCWVDRRLNERRELCFDGGD
jgi:hypothetical protein